MANINDFKILTTKCIHYFSLFENENGKQFSSLTEIQKARFGFYYLMIENICDIKDISDITPLITDMDFNSTIFKNNNEDCGVDAVYFDEESFTINIFNFKFRENFNIDKQQNINESFITAKFIQAISNENTNGLKGQLKQYADRIIEAYRSKDIWKMKFYIVSNENKELASDIPEFKNLEDLYDLEVIPIGLDKISQMLSLRPKAINASLHLDNDSLLTFAENSISTAKSFVIKIAATELLRITCNNETFRNNYSMEDYSVLFDTDMDFNVLFDNVRGFVVKSKFNKNMMVSLEKEPAKFFMYNNGLTLTAEDVVSETTNAGKKIKLTVNNFQVVNGGQTLRTIHEFKKLDKKNIDNYLANCQVLLRIFKTQRDTITKNRIAEYTNSQNKISVIDLKALSSEQLQIESFLADKNILYTRKSGDIGSSNTNKTFSKQISMERFGQILFSLYGFPEKASNQKKDIFEKYYNELFIDNFDINKTEKYVLQYYEVKKTYEKLPNFTYTDQKAFYILYLETLENNFFDTMEAKIKFFENELKDFNPGDNRSDSRKLIMSFFKENLKDDYTNYSK